MLTGASVSASDQTTLIRPAEEVEKLAGSALKLLEVDDPYSVSEVKHLNELWGVAPDRASGRVLTWLHDFLKKKCGTDDLTNAHQLGLNRMRDKTTNSYLWVHHTQM